MLVDSTLHFDEVISMGKPAMLNTALVSSKLLASRFGQSDMSFVESMSDTSDLEQEQVRHMCGFTQRRLRSGRDEVALTSSACSRVVWCTEAVRAKQLHLIQTPRIACALPLEFELLRAQLFCHLARQRQ